MTRTLQHSVLVFALLSACGLAARSRAADLKLRDRVVPGASVVRLGDVAEIVAADRQEARHLAGLPLMPAPAPNTERFLRKREIEDMLAAQGVKLGDIRITGAEQVAIASAAPSPCPLPNGEASGTPLNRRAAILAGASGQRTSTTKTTMYESRCNQLRDDVRRTIVEYLNSKTGTVAERRIECNVPDRQLAMLDRATSPPVCQGGTEPWIGRQTFTLSFATADGNQQVPIYADVVGPAVPVVFAIRPIARGNVFTAADIEVRTIESTAKTMGQRTALDSVESLLGKEARQAIQAGQIVFADQVQEPVLVKRGDLVSVTSECGGIRVKTTARAKQDGSRGELVQVESLDSREPFDARVVGPREATVFSQARPTATARLDTDKRY